MVERRSDVRGCYVYGVIQSSEPRTFGAIGIHGAWPEVFTIHYQDLAAVVSDVPLARLEATRSNLLAHEEVNERVMRDHTVIPMAFGAIFHAREDVVELLRATYDACRTVLAAVRGKVEFGVKVLWDREAVIRAIEQEDQDIRQLKAELCSSTGSTNFARMQYARLLDAKLQERQDRYVAAFLQGLREVSVASRMNRTIGAKMILNAVFLVRRDKEPAFDRRLREIASRFEALSCRYTGPWPPYNFVNIRLKLKPAGDH